MNKYWREWVVGMLIIANVSVWVQVYVRKSDGLLKIYFLNVGQGDSILIDSPTHKRILIDGGPDRKVLPELGKILPFGDRNIDVVIETHPDADHITGLVDVVRRYKVDVFLEPGVESLNNVDNLLRSTLILKNTKRLFARRGMNINIGGGAYLLILYPNQDVSSWEANDASVVAKLIYKNKSFMLTGDSTKSSEYKLMGLGEGVLDADVLKAGHHGSDTSSSILYTQIVSPEYAVISSGKNNRYGHPSKKVLEIFKNFGSKIVNTAEVGTVMFETNGENLVLK